MKLKKYWRCKNRHMSRLQQYWVNRKRWIMSVNWAESFNKPGKDPKCSVHAQLWYHELNKSTTFYSDWVFHLSFLWSVPTFLAARSLLSIEPITFCSFPLRNKDVQSLPACRLVQILYQSILVVFNKNNSKLKFNNWQITIILTNVKLRNFSNNRAV